MLRGSGRLHYILYCVELHYLSSDGMLEARNLITSGNERESFPRRYDQGWLHMTTGFVLTFLTT
jgi:hypothetical protein